MTSRTKTSYTVCFCAAMFFLGLSASYLAPLVTRITGNIGVTLSVFSTLIILKSLAYSAGSFLLGRAQRSVPTNKLIAGGLLVLPVVTWVYPQTRSAAAVVIALLIWGVTGALVEGGIDVQNSILPEDFAGRLNYLQYAAMSLGAMVGPVLLNRFMKGDADVLRLPFWTVLPAVIFAVWIFFLREPEPSEHHAEEEQAAPHKGLCALVIASAVLMFFACGGDCALNDWSPTAVLREAIADEADAALLPMFFAVGSLLSRFISAAAVKKLKPEASFSISVTLVFIAAAGMLFTRSFRAMLGLNFLYGFGNGVIFSALLLLLRSRGHANGSSVGFVMGLKNLGDMIIPWLTGIVLDRAGGSACFGVIASSALFVFILHFVVRASGESANRGK